MIREAELFVMAEQVLVEVIGRVRTEHMRNVVPPLLDRPGADKPLPMRQVINRLARDEAWVPDMLAGATMDEVGPDKFDGELLGDDPHGAITRLSEAACAAAREVTDGDAPVHCSFGDISTREYLWQLDLARCFLAHDVAMNLGSRACPFTEELARGMLEGTGPEAARWRSLGFFREPLPFPDGHVSWRDQFLLTAGRDPHPWMD